MSHLSTCIAVAGAIVLGGAHAAHAQAWVGAKGSLDVSLDYNLGSSSKVVGDKGVEFPTAGTTTHQVTLGAEYTPIDKLALTVSVPYAALKYTGQQGLYPHPGGGSYDDGSFHGTFTDLGASVRYQVLEDPIALAPFIAVTLPLQSYETVGNTVAGRHLKGVTFGVAIGKEFGDAYAHVSYGFSLVEKYDRTADTSKYSQNYSDASLTLGYKLLDSRLDLNLDANARIHHGGLNFSQAAMWTSDEALYHDPILAEQIFLVGAGVGYQLTNALGVSLGGRLFVGGQNTQNASVLALGLTWTAL